MNDRHAASDRSSEILLRVLSALVLISVALAASFAGGYAFAALCVAGGALALFEYLGIVGPIPRGLRIIAYTAFFATFLAFGLQQVTLALAVAGVCVTAIAILEFLRRGSVWVSTGFCYTIIPATALVQLRGSGAEPLLALLFLFAAVWGSDTFAYLAGRTIGGPKFAPTISPKKTWSGFFGGLLGAVVAAMAVVTIYGYNIAWPGIAFALLLGFVTSMGDLFESWIKRRFGKKDSGSIIPGHGGVLDRIDGLIFAASVAWLTGWTFGGAPFTPGETGKILVAAIASP